MRNTIPLDLVPLVASSLARGAHANQYRRDGVTPYIRHPEAVARSLAGEHPNVIAVAWLHDVLEDTEATVEELKEAGFPLRVVDAVERLTKKDGTPYEDYLEGIKLDDIATKVKIADIRHNLSDDPTERQRAKYEKALLFLTTKKKRTYLLEERLVRQEASDWERFLAFKKLAEDLEQELESKH
jgi:hypothetical protein